MLDTTFSSNQLNFNPALIKTHNGFLFDNIEKEYIDDEIFPRFEFTWTNNTGNDIDYLEIDFKEYDENNACTPWSSVEENISAGETRKITLYPKEKSTERIEITGVKIYHVPTNNPSEIYEGCIPGMWYKLDK